MSMKKEQEKKEQEKKKQAKKKKKINENTEIDENTKVNENTKISENTKIKEQKKESSKQTRVNKNRHLYLDDMDKTKQQKFNFEKNDLEDELDNTFVEKRKKKNKKNEVIIEKKVYPKILISFLVLLIVFLSSFLCYHYITFNHHKVKIKKVIKKEVIVDENIVFLGDSLINRYDLKKYFPNYHVVNSGVGGNVTDHILDDMENRVYQYNPSKVFLLVGTNDLQWKRSPDEILDNIKKIVNGIHENREKAEIYIESLYPVNREIKNNGAEDRNNEDIKEVNKKLKEYCQKEKLTYIDMYQQLEDENGNLKEEYTKEGLHLSDKGYDEVTKKIKQYLD